MARTATGIDVGSATVKLLRGEVKGSTFVVSEFQVAPNPGGTVGSGWQVLAGTKPGLVRVGVTGREVNMRYTRVPRLPDWKLRNLMRFEAEEVGGQSESHVASDFNVLPEIPEIEGEDVVVLCMARESLLEEHLEGMSAAGAKLDAFTPNAIGLYNAFLQYGVVLDDTVLVANIGKQNTDVILMRGTDLLFARNMAGGSELFDQAIADRFEVDVARAEAYKVDEGTLDLGGRFTDANQEKAARAMTAPAGQLNSLLQSAVMFAKSQVKLTTLKLDRVFLCGGGAALPGLTEYLSSAMGVPVELFDPFVVVDSTKLDAESAMRLEEHKLEAVCALGLAASASDPDAYGIEILPESVRKRRDFVTGPAWVIAAAVLAVLFLGLFAVKKSGELDELTTEAMTTGSRLRAAKSKHHRTEALLAENAAYYELGQELFALKGAGEQTLRALDVFERELPADFWLDTMTLAYGVDDDLGIAREDERPILRVRGLTRQGTDSPTVLFSEFVSAFQRDVPEAVTKDRMGQRDFTFDTTSLGPPREPSEDDAEGADDSEDEE